MAETSIEPLREKFLRAFLPMVKRPAKQTDLKIKDPLERFELAIIQAANRQLKEREDLEHRTS